MGNPDTAAMRRTRPTAMNPGVAVAVPTVVAVDPHPSFMRWMVMDLDDRCRRRNADDDLRHRNRRSETQGKQPCQESLFHRNRNLRGLDLPESGNLFLAVNDINPTVGNWLRAAEKSAPKSLWIRMRVRAEWLTGDCSRLPWRKDIAQALDLRTDADQLLFEAFVAAIHVIHAVDDGLALCDESSQDQ